MRKVRSQTKVLKAIEIIYSQPACISGGVFKSIMALAASMSGSGKINQ